MEDPKLIDNGAINYMYEALNICHSNRVKIYSIALNVGVLILFIVITATALYYCYKKKPTPYELKRKMLKDQEYILTKIRQYQGEKLRLSESLYDKIPVNSGFSL
jgi:hypothetical protein